MSKEESSKQWEGLFKEFTEFVKRGGFIVVLLFAIAKRLLDSGGKQ